MNENKNGHEAVQLYAYVKFMIWMLVLLIGLDVGVYFLDFYSGLLMSLGLCLYAVIIIAYYFYQRRKAVQSLMDFAAEFSSVQTRLMDKFAFPYALIDKNAVIVWANEEFKSITRLEKSIRRQPFGEIFQDFSIEELPGAGHESEFLCEYRNRYYSVNIKYITDDNTLKTFDIPDVQPADLTRMYAVSMFDETDLRYYIRQYEDEMTVPGILYIDNYDETIENFDDVKRSIMMAVIDRKLNSYFGEIDAIIRKYENDKYVFVMRSRTLRELKEGKFPVLQEMKELNVGNDVRVTVSMGIGINQGSYQKNMEAARVSINLALGRGGDQVVIKDGEAIQYFGGKTMAVEKNTKVKARVKAHALREILTVAEKVVVMGHKMPDPDCFGAAIGIHLAAKSINKKSYIVIDQETAAISALIKRFKNSPDYGREIFITNEEAKNIVDETTVLVVVDTCMSDYTCCPELLEMTKSIVVLDHHRISSSVIKNPALSYIEPYASSACEMIAEILQYFSEKVKIKGLEADALYAGIVIDTDNFIQKSGVRTFEAAAYLRRCGADSIRVRKMFREDIKDIVAKSNLVSNAKLYRNMFAISTVESSSAEDPTVVGAQAANDLLDIKGVRASFVLTAFNEMIYISARSIDEINVQLVMERLGGGGHINIAGTQLKDMTIEDAEKKLEEVLDEMIDGGDI